MPWLSSKRKSAGGSHRADGTVIHRRNPILGDGKQRLTLLSVLPVETRMRLAHVTTSIALVLACNAVQGCASKHADVAPTVETSRITRDTDEWPFQSWRRAHAYTFNFVPEGSGIQTTLYSPWDGWNDRLRSEHALNRDAAVEIAAAITAMRGGVAFSKTQFPRHGIAFFDDDSRDPVGVVSIGFPDQTIHVWPDFEESGTVDGARDRAIHAAFRYLRSVFLELGEPVWLDPRDGPHYFETAP